MTERQLQFRVGLFVIVAMVIAGVMTFRFGEVKTFWEKHYQLSIHFREAPGVQPSIPVRRNGVTIGSVKEVNFDEKRGGVNVVVEIKEDCRLREDTEAEIKQSLLGDASIAFTPGVSRQFLEPGDELEGRTQLDPIEVVERLDRKMTGTLESFAETSQEWKKVGGNLNRMMETHEGNFTVILERAATSLNEFTKTMKSANETIASVNNVVGDPKTQESLQAAAEALPKMVEETQRTITAVRKSVEAADKNLKNLSQVTVPLAQHSRSIIGNLDRSLANLESLSAELNQFSKLLSKEDGSLHQFVKDKELYRNLNRSAGSLAMVLNNLDPVMRDLRIFSDKIARHPELMGVGGALNGSSGIKEPPSQVPLQGELPEAGPFSRQ